MLSSPIEPSKPSIASLLVGLFNDVKLLAIQELRLAQHETQAELQKATIMAISVCLGIGLAVIGGILLVVMIVHLLQAMTDWPLWACYGAVGVLSSVGSFALLLKAKSQAGAIRFIPFRTLRTMKESTTWLKETITSLRT